MLVTEELSYKLQRESGSTFQECVKALANNSTYTDALLSLINNTNDNSKIRKGSIVVIITKTGNINSFAKGTITKVLNNKSKRTLLLDEMVSGVREDLKLDYFENKKILLLEDINALIHHPRHQYYLRYNNRPCAFEFIVNVRLATKEEKKKYHKLVKQIKY